MKSDYCKSCEFVIWLVAIGQGIKCNHSKNKKDNNPISINEIQNCKYYKNKRKK